MGVKILTQLVSQFPRVSHDASPKIPFLSKHWKLYWKLGFYHFLTEKNPAQLAVSWFLQQEKEIGFENKTILINYDLSILFRWKKYNKSWFIKFWFSNWIIFGFQIFEENLWIITILNFCSKLMVSLNKTALFYVFYSQCVVRWKLSKQKLSLARNFRQFRISYHAVVSSKIRFKYQILELRYIYFIKISKI